MLKKIALSALAMLSLAACGPVEDTRPGQPVKTRQTAFKEMLHVTEPMGAMFRTGPYDAVVFEELAVKLHPLRDTPWAHFGPDTQYPPSRALDSVWSDPSGFRTQIERFQTHMDDMLTAARTHEETEAKTAFEALQDSCRSCHQTYRKK